METLKTKNEAIESAENYCIENGILFSNISFNLTENGQIIVIDGTDKVFTYTENQIYNSNK